MMPTITQKWREYVATVQCNCVGPDPVAAQAACPIHAYNTGHLPWVNCNLIQASVILQLQGCNCPPVTPAQVAAYIAAGGATPIAAAVS